MQPHKAKRKQPVHRKQPDGNHLHDEPEKKHSERSIWKQFDVVNQAKLRKQSQALAVFALKKIFVRTLRDKTCEESREHSSYNSEISVPSCPVHQSWRKSALLSRPGKQKFSDHHLPVA